MSRPAELAALPPDYGDLYEADDPEAFDAAAAPPPADIDGLADDPEAFDAAAAPPPADIDGLAEEFLRVLGLLPVVVAREEWIVASDGAWLLRSFLVRLLVAENGEGVMTGVKRLNEKLTDEQRAIVEGLPPIVATRDGVIASHQAIAEAFLPRARRLATRWPSELEAATRGHLEREGLWAS